MRKQLPASILRLPKQGFTPPLSYWLQEKRFQDFIRDEVGRRSFQNLDVIKQSTVDRLLPEH